MGGGDIGDTVTRLGGHGSTNVEKYVGRRRFNFARERPRIRGWREKHVSRGPRRAHGAT